MTPQIESDSLPKVCEEEETSRKGKNGVDLSERSNTSSYKEFLGIIKDNTKQEQ